MLKHEQHYLDVFPKEQLVYLTSESENLLERLEPDKTYVVGALVDHNRRKGLTHGLAQEAGVATARLPIAEHVQLQCGTMLAVNHVFKLCLEFEQHQGTDEERWAASTQVSQSSSCLWSLELL